ncbi:MBL fold metallo-hydrolase [Citricoccus nitrophenolicus]|uniref:MBL fold metallo-hydrolase n=1 Tax=Citricoccus nitrophenolicus TaxID=863575 RepID=UPI0039B5BF11
MIDLDQITIRSISVSETDNNVYLLTHKLSGHQVLIDAADDPEAIRSMLVEAGADAAREPRVSILVTTHSHWDHVRALAEITEYTGAATAAGTEDAPDIEIPTDLPLESGPLDAGGGLELEVIKLRGHTPGSVALLYQDPTGPDHLFTGDSLFPGGIGNTFEDPERFTSLIDDVTARIFNVMPDDTIVHPGHGKGTTLGAERPHLEEWRERGW